MSQPAPVDILSDSDSEPRPHNLINDAIDLTTPPPFPQSKKKKKLQRIDSSTNPSNYSTVFIIDDDPTPSKNNPTSLVPMSSATPSFVAETPFSDVSIVKCTRRKYSFSAEGLATGKLVVADTPMSKLSKPEVSITKCNIGVPQDDLAYSLILHDNSAAEGLATEKLVVADTPMSNLSKSEVSITKRNTGTPKEINEWICVESDNEYENVGGYGASKHDESVLAANWRDDLEIDSGFVQQISIGTSAELQKKSMQNPVEKHRLEIISNPCILEDVISVACDGSDGKPSEVSSVGKTLSQQENTGCSIKERKKAYETMKPKRTSKEERLRLIEEKKQLKEQEKLFKAASKAEAAGMKKLKKEMQKWEKGKYAQKSVVAEIDRKVVELGSIGGHLLTRFAEKGLSYCITSNPIERTILWTMAIPQEISAMASDSDQIEISYALVIYEAEEFCNLVMNGSLIDHVERVQHFYPHHTICYVTNRLMSYINKREQVQYKNPANNSGWKQPAVEEVFTKLATHFSKVHSRLCVDEAELAEHVVGLTCSLASCQFRKKLTRLSVNANGSIVPKDCMDKSLIKKNVWLKALVAIPKVQPRFAIAISKRYPTMKSLLSVYMDPTKSVHEKEFLLKDLTTEGLLGDDRRVGEVCSKRIYRILMAQSGNIKTDDVENGADFFSRQST